MLKTLKTPIPGSLKFNKISENMNRLSFIRFKRFKIERWGKISRNQQKIIPVFTYTNDLKSSILFMTYNKYCINEGGGLMSYDLREILKNCKNGIIILIVE